VEHLTAIVQGLARSVSPLVEYISKQIADEAARREDADARDARREKHRKAANQVSNQIRRELTDLLCPKDPEELKAVRRVSEHITPWLPIDSIDGRGDQAEVLLAASRERVASGEWSEVYDPRSAPAREAMKRLFRRWKRLQSEKRKAKTK
jgi:hypothetical protein